MADRATMMRALRNADAAGDTEAAQRIAAMIRQADAPAALREQAGWGETFSTAVGNIPSSAMRYGKDIYEAVSHPVETLKSMGGLISGATIKLLLSGVSDEQMATLSPEQRATIAQLYKYPEAAAKIAMDRYGSVENLKNTIATDPVGVLSDATAVLMGVGAVGARAPGMVGKIGRTVRRAGELAEPLSVVGRGVKYAAKPVGSVAKNALGVTTGAGGTAIGEAFHSGYAGRAPTKAFTQNMRGRVLPQEVVISAKAALKQMRAERAAAYRHGMAGVTSDPKRLDFSAIDRAVERTREIGISRGQSGKALPKIIDKSTADVWQKIAGVVDDYRNSAPDEWHTALGFDALKQTIGDIRDSTEFGTPSRLVADNVYNAIKSEIVKQAPDYARIMADYTKASDLVVDIEKALSLGNKAAADTSLRRLQSVMRNNANTNYGNRIAHAMTLQEAGAPNLMSSLAGQALSSPTPRGLQGLGAAGTGAAMALSGNPLMIPSLAASSPRLVGEAVLKAGQAARGVELANKHINPLISAQWRALALQGGRLQRELEGR